MLQKWMLLGKAPFTGQATRFPASHAVYPCCPGPTSALPALKLGMQAKQTVDRLRTLLEAFEAARRACIHATVHARQPCNVREAGGPMGKVF
eukprot:1157914-Pelagomonas_calceolata.AAC.7